MNETFELLKNILSDNNIEFAEIGNQEISCNNFVVDSWDVEPDINYNNIDITILITYQSFNEYLDMWTPEFQKRINESFEIVKSSYDNNDKQLEVNLFCKIDKELN